MKSFILIIISLFLGFWQGSRLKKRKLRNEITMLNKKIEELNNEIQKISRKNRLSMYDHRFEKKYDQNYLEERLTEYVTSKSQHTNLCYTYLSFIKCIIKDMDALINQENFKDLTKQLLDDLKYIKSMPMHKIKNKCGYTSKPLDECIKNLEIFFEEIEIHNYSITYRECYDSIALVLETIDV